MRASLLSNIVVLWASIAATAFGADNASTLGTPVLGLVSATGTTEVRAVVGVPSSASLSSPLSLPLYTQDVNVDSPELTGALTDNAGWSVFRLGPSLDDAVTLAAIDGFDGGSGGTFAFSPSGTAAVYFSAGRVQVLDILSQNPKVTWTSAASIQEAAALAISDDGSMAAIADGSHVYLLQAQVAPLLMQITQGSPAVTFLAGGEALAVVDAGVGSITLHENLSGSASTRVVASETSFAGEQMLVGSGSAGADLFLAAVGESAAFRVGVADGTVDSVALPASVTRLDRIGAGDLFVFSYESNQPAWLLWSDGATFESMFAAATPLQLRDSRTRR